MEINVIIDGKFAGCPDAGWFQNIMAQVLDAQDAEPNTEVGLVITGEKKVRELNVAYRGEDRSTDVLAFYMTQEGDKRDTETTSFVSPPDGVLHLGEVVISYPQAVMQAQEHRHSVAEELAILIVHGVLHLLGCDHEKVAQKREMAAKERTILDQIILEQERKQ